MRVPGFLMLCLAASAWAETASVSRYGPNDRLGALNALTPDIVLQATQLIRTGKVYSLAAKVRSEAKGRRHFQALIQPIQSLASNQITGFDDTVILSPGLGTSMDGLAHAGRNGRHYNGVQAEDVYGLDGVKVFGIDTLPPIVTRGVLLDVARYRTAALVSEATPLNLAEIKAILKTQNVTIRRGDVVLLHTGWSDHRPSDVTQRIALKEPGLGKEGARYLADLGVVAVGADTDGVEINPAETSGEYAPVHQILLVDNGIYLLENVSTAELAADRAYEFLFVAAAPRLVGTVQSSLHPIAIR